MSDVITIAGTAIRQDDKGRYSLNDLHRAAGGEKRHQPSDWLRVQQTQDLVFELDSQIPGNPGIQSKQGLGTFVCKELVYAYAMWISAAFHLKVIHAYDQMVASPKVDPMAVLNDPAAMRGLLLTYSEKVIALETQVQQQAPKVEALDRLSTANGSLCITDAAKALQAQPKKLFSWLRENRWIYRRAGNSGYLGYQDRIVAGVLEHKVTTVSREDGTEKVVEQVRVTPKGLARIAQSMELNMPPKESATAAATAMARMSAGL